jgi:hypothetical protein
LYYGNRPYSSQKLTHCQSIGLTISPHFSGFSTAILTVAGDFTNNEASGLIFPTTQQSPSLKNYLGYARIHSVDSAADDLIKCIASFVAAAAAAAAAA